MVPLQFLNVYALAHHITDFIWNYALNVTTNSIYKHSERAYANTFQRKAICMLNMRHCTYMRLNQWCVLYKIHIIDIYKQILIYPSSISYSEICWIMHMILYLRKIIDHIHLMVYTFNYNIRWGLHKNSKKNQQTIAKHI